MSKKKSKRARAGNPVKGEAPVPGTEAEVRPAEDSSSKSEYDVQAVPETEVEAAQVEGEEAEPEPEPEPWTPERVLAWNAYYDFYVVAGVLLLVFFASATKIGSSTIWTMLQSGRTIVAKSAPLTTDPFSYTMEGKSWVNVPWLYELAMSQVYDLAYSQAPSNPNRAAQAQRAEQIAAGALGAVTAVIRVLTALVLLGIRRPGPGLWWTAICTTLALGVIFSPLGFILGGIARQAQAEPESLGLLFLAVELYLLHRVRNLGRTGALWGLIPLFLLWANVDGSVTFGLFVLAASLLTPLLFPGARTAKPVDGAEPTAAPSRGTVLTVLIGCILVCLANPSTIGLFGVILKPLWAWTSTPSGQMLYEDVSILSAASRAQLGEGFRDLLGYYLILVGTGLASFVLNMRRFSPSRFAIFVVSALLLALGTYRYMGEFGLVWAAVLALNGQEWYQDRFGTEGHLGWKWVVWSTGGRGVTLVLVFTAIILKVLTGYSRLPTEPPFGFGAQTSRFSFDAAEYLRSAPIKGQVLNTSTAQGDAIVWKAYPLRKSFIDSRPNLFTPELREEFQTVREALRDDKIEDWAPILDKHGISAIMVPMGDGSPGALEQPSLRTYVKLMSSPNWIPFYDDGNVVMFGRSTEGKAVSGEDIAYFRSNILDPDTLAFKRPGTVPSPERPPGEISDIDKLFPGRTQTPPHPRVLAAGRWLTPLTEAAQDAAAGNTAGRLPSPARCLMAIREARTALASNPDDSAAWYILHTAYRLLGAQEMALLAGIALTPENTERIIQFAADPNVLQLRARESLSALVYAIRTTPPPQGPDASDALGQLEMQVFGAYQERGFLDEAQKRLVRALELLDPESITDQMRQTLAQLDEQIEKVRQDLNDVALEQNARPVDLAGRALQQGCPGLALEELKKALELNEAANEVKPLVLDLYTNLGEPDVGIELLGNIDDPALSTGPGTVANRQAMASVLLGNTENAIALWSSAAIPQVRAVRTVQAISSTMGLFKGDVPDVVRMFRDRTIPSAIATQALWEFELGLTMLEAGQPDGAAEHLTKVLTLVPDSTFRPIVAYYLEKLGKPVPPPKETTTATPATGTTTESPAPAPADGTKPAPAPTPDPNKPTDGATPATGTPPAEPPKTEESAKKSEEPAKQAEEPTKKSEEPAKPEESTKKSDEPAKPAEPASAETPK